MHTYKCSVMDSFLSLRIYIYIYINAHQRCGGCDACAHHLCECLSCAAASNSNMKKKKKYYIERNKPAISAARSKCFARGDSCVSLILYFHLSNKLCARFSLFIIIVEMRPHFLMVCGMFAHTKGKKKQHIMKIGSANR